MFYLQFWIQSCYTNDCNLVHISDLSFEWQTLQQGEVISVSGSIEEVSQVMPTHLSSLFLGRLGANYKLERHQCKQTKDKFLHCFTPASVKVGETSLIVRWGPGWVAVGFSLIYVNRFSCSNHLMRILVCKTYGRQQFHFKWYTQKFHFAFLNSYK